MYLQNSYESQAHFLPSDADYFDRLAKAFEFYESQRQQGSIQYYGMSTWLCFRAKPEEEKIYLNFQKCLDVAKKIGGDSHGFKFVQMPMNVMQPEAFVEPWQEYADDKQQAAQTEANLKIMVVVANLT